LKNIWRVIDCCWGTGDSFPGSWIVFHVLSEMAFCPGKHVSRI
jgi:hypothetical protein